MSAAKGSKDQQAIRRLDAKWGVAASAGKIKDVVGFYAPHGSVVWPGAPAAHGTASIRAAWQKMFRKCEELTLKFTPKRVDVSQAKDMAVDFGRVAIGYKEPKKGRVMQEAKYVVVWTKIGREWKVLYDCYNTNNCDNMNTQRSKATRKRAPHPAVRKPAFSRYL